MFITNQKTESLNRLFPNLILFQILLFRLYLTKFVNNLVIYPQKKVSLQNLVLFFDLERHSQTSLETEFVMFSLIFMKFTKLNASTEKKTRSPQNVRIFTFKSWAKIVF